jgi:hypothetical protein
MLSKLRKEDQSAIKAIGACNLATSKKRRVFWHGGGLWMTNESEEREVFSKKMVDILNYGALNLAIGIGYRVGLHKIMDIFDGPQTLSIIAQKAGRYGFWRNSGSGTGTRWGKHILLAKGSR